MKLSEIAKEILSQSYNVTDQAGEERHVVDAQDVMDILNRLASSGLLSGVIDVLMSKINRLENKLEETEYDSSIVRDIDKYDLECLKNTLGLIENN